MTVDIKKTHPQFIFMQVREQHQELWDLVVVYGSPSLSLRRRLWRDLRTNSLNIKDPWLAMRYFNAG